MPAQDMEVSITLTPQGDQQHQNRRTFKITPHKKSIPVGRASKNPHKGLHAAADNAIFDYPIMSREHAQFSASSSKKALYLKDRGSTHGTYLDSLRLSPQIDYRLNNGEVVTFGVEVTNGPLHYPAKAFRVNYIWQPHSTATPAKAPGLVSKGDFSFSVPDDVHDSPSERSREGSIQIVESHPRTYSVPSSLDDLDSDEIEDDEDVIITSSVKAGNKDLAVTTPDLSSPQIDTEASKNTPKTNDTPRLNLKGPTLHELLTNHEAQGTSQLTPINLEPSREQRAARKASVSDTESEGEDKDEAPEVLSIHQAPKTSRNEPIPRPETAPVLNGLNPELDARSREQPRKTEQTVEDVKDVSIKAKEVADSQLPTRDLDIPQSFAPTPNAPTPVAGHESDSFDEDENEDEDFPMSDDEAIEPVFFDFGQVAPIQKQYNITSSMIPTVQAAKKGSGQNDVSRSEAIDVSVVAPGNTALPPRAPSPSDAALARKATLPSVPSLGPMVNSCMSFCDDEPPLAFPRAFCPDYNSKIPYDPSREASDRLKPYSTGPFSMDQGSAHRGWDSLGQDFWDVENGTTRNSMPEKYCAPLVPALGPAPIMNQKTYRVHAPMLCPRTPIRERRTNNEQAVGGANDHVKTSPIFTSKPSYENLSQSSKINIANLVNRYHAGNPPQRKRRAADISSDDDIEPLVEISQAPTSVAASTTQETPLTDAQPRDIVMAADKAISQYEVVDPAVSSTTTTINTKTCQVEGPARKKARNSTSKTGGIARFVGGVCVGVVGAIAAILALTPDSVQEEALREVNFS